MSNIPKRPSPNSIGKGRLIFLKMEPIYCLKQSSFSSISDWLLVYKKLLLNVNNILKIKLFGKKMIYLLTNNGFNSTYLFS